MSAIAGILYFNGAPVQPGLIEKLTGAMASRGPDARTHWVKGSIAMGHCMLRTTPEAAEECQPVVSRDGSLILVWDGRIDNRDDLRHALKSSGTAVRNNTDAELALQSYVAWGERCPERLLGDFALAVWDANQHRLFCATDHFGARPFFYCRTDNFLAFASEDEALLNLPGVSNQPNEALIASYLVPGFRGIDRSRSLLEDVSVLRAARIMLVSANGKCRSHSYWQLEPGDEYKFASDEECEEAFVDIFSKAVRSRMRSSAGIAAMVSGGLDSASIFVMVNRLLPQMPAKDFHTYSAISDHPESCIESQCISALVENSLKKAHFVLLPSFTGFGSVEDLIEIGWSRAHPVDNSILLPAMMCMGASRDGHRVLLHGCSGDLTMYAPDRYIAHILRKANWGLAWSECRSASGSHTYLRGTSASRILWSNIRTAFIPQTFKKFIRPLRQVYDKQPSVREVVNDEFIHRLQIKERLKEQKYEYPYFHNDYQREHIRILSSRYGLANGLRGYERVAGRFGIELRDPWADRRVVEFFLRLPLKYKVREGSTKYLARHSFKRELHIKLRQRVGREHIGWQFPSRLMQESRGLMKEVLCDYTQFIENYFDLTCAQSRYSQYTDSSSETRADGEQLSKVKNDLYAIITLALWLKRIDVI